MPCPEPADPKSLSAAVMFVGEQPGDQEDKAGEPCVGPAGRVLDEALAERGSSSSFASSPDLVVALGATAAQALLGPAFRVTKERGKLRSSPLASRVVATVHPSSILRAPPDSRDGEMRAFVKDLRGIAKLLHD